MRTRRGFFGFLLASTLVAPLCPLAAQEDFRPSTEAPRLLLRPQRLRLLRRERQRESMRWQQFHTLMAGKARMPEPGFALGLYSQVTEQPSYCRQAAEWALGPANDLRQLALVYDWCRPAMSDQQAAAIAGLLEKAVRPAGTLDSIPAVRSRVFAALALADDRPEIAERVMREAVQQWWRGKMIPGLRSGRIALPTADLYPLYELLHAVRDNLNMDLREPVGAVFKELPALFLLSHYPAPYPAAENEYYIPALKDAPEPELNRAALSRAAALSMVAFDVNALESQFLQGWLMHDRFLLRGAFGTVYEYLWANPYQPGLSYFHLPLISHDSIAGRLFLRSSWEEDAAWVGWFDGQLQSFSNGVVKILAPRPEPAPIYVADAAVVYGRNVTRIVLEGRPVKPPGKAADAPGSAAGVPEASGTQVLFVVGLTPRGKYDVEVDGEEMREETADPGGILALPVAPTDGLKVRLRPVKPVREPSRADTGRTGPTAP